MKKPCPKCQAEGHDNSGDNLHVYPDGHAYCHRCSYYVKNYEEGGEYSPSVQEVEPRMKLSEARSLPIRRLRHKPISRETCEKYGVRIAVNSETGQIDEVLYPYTKNNEVVAYKTRKLPKQFSWIGDPKDTTLFGLNAVKKKGKYVIVTEGEDDCLAVYDMLVKKGKQYNVVSIPNGANQNGTIDKKVKACVDFFSAFDTVVVAFDMDDPGQESAKVFAHWLAPFCEVRVLSLPRKDPAEMLINSETDTFFECLRKAEEYKPDDVICGSDLSLEDLRKPLPEGYKIPYPILQDKLQGLRKQELTLLCAGSGVGKTTFARELAYDMVTTHNLRMAHIFLEEDVTKTAMSYIAIHNNVPLPALRINPNVITEEQWKDSYEKYLGSERLFFTDHFGSLESHKLIDKCRYFVHACDVDFIMLDHISMVISGQESSNERKDIDMLMTNLAAFVNETGVGVVAIVHLRRAQSGSFNEGKEISLNDLRGSGGLEQLSWNVIALERNQQDPDNKNQSQIRLLKNREWGSLGLCDTLIFNQDTGRLLPHNSEEY